MFILALADGTAVAGAKITLSGVGMDGGQGIHTIPDPSYTPEPEDQDLPTYWLGALGSIAPGTGSMLISHIKEFLKNQTENKSFKIGAYTVARWGVKEGQYEIPQNSPLVNWFQGQGFRVQDYSWKAAGTWDSYFGGVLAGIEYVYRP